MTSLWIARLFFFVRVVDVSASLRNAIADALANNGSGQARAHELAMFNSSARLSLSGSTPAQVVGWNVAVKPAMRDEIRTLVTALPQSRYYIVANTDVPSQGWADGQLIQTDSPGAQSQLGQIFTWQDALSDLFAERGLRLIVGASSL